MKKVLWILCVLGALAAASIAGGLYWQSGLKHQPSPAVDMMIPHGASSVKISHLLQGHDVIASATVFRLVLRWQGSGNRLRSGLYHFEQPANVFEVIERLLQGDVMHFKVTVPEGLRTDEVLHLLARKTGTNLSDWQAAFKRLLPHEPEGRLLPETYQYDKPIRILYLLKSMLNAQDKVLAPLASNAKEKQRLRIMASIIEKETRLEHERPIVAAVIHNRLKKHMPLQMDPTVIYGLWKTTGSFSGNIHKRDLRTNTPWNSYTNRGLPPTPIGNPGAASLRAAAAPANVSFLYFVADGTGGHQFASTLAKHNANVARWIRIERTQRRGK